MSAYSTTETPYEQRHWCEHFLMASVILAVHNYTPETNAAAKRATATAEYLARQDWQVTVITLLPHHPQNTLYEGYDVRAPHITLEKGVRIVRLRPWLVPKDSLALRLLSETIFSLQVFAHLFRHRYDLVFASSPYMFLGPLSLLASRFKGKPFVWDVRDLTWLYPKAAGKRTFGLDRVLERLMRYTARSADALTTATEGLLSYFEQRPTFAKTIPNAVSDELLNTFELLCDTEPFANERVNVVYAGLFGYNHGLATLIETARLLPKVQFTLCGDGPEDEMLKGIVQDYRLTNVAFTGYLKPEELLEHYKEADILVSHVRRQAIFKWTQPAKLWEYMATGRPVVHAGEGEASRILEENNIALAIPPEQPQQMADAICELIHQPEKARELGLRGRRFVERKRSRERLMQELRALLETVLTRTNSETSVKTPRP